MKKSMLILVAALGLSSQVSAYAVDWAPVQAAGLEFAKASAGIDEAKTQATYDKYMGLAAAAYDADNKPEKADAFKKYRAMKWKEFAEKNEALVAMNPGLVKTAVVATASVDGGKKLYESVCFACHGAGIAGAPKFGDKAAWTTRVQQGEDTLISHAIKGYQGKAGMMPPKGGSNASDADVKAAVQYMINAAK